MAARPATKSVDRRSLNPERSEQQLRESAAYFRAMFEQARATLTGLKSTISVLEKELGAAFSALERELPLQPASNAENLAVHSGVPAAPAAHGGLEGALQRGEALKAQWVRDGVLVPSTVLAEAWGVTPQALQQATVRGELFSLKVAGKTYYLGLLRGEDRAVVAQVCRALGAVEPSGQLIFWMRKHGGLAGKTVAEALAGGKLPRVLQLAQAWADEHSETSGSAE